MTFFRIEDDKQTIYWNINDPKVYLKLKDSQIRVIGRIVFDSGSPVFIAEKKTFKLKKSTGFSFNFFILPYVERIDLLCDRIMYRISRTKAMQKGALIYFSHSKFEQQIFIDLRYFSTFQKEGNQWIQKK